MPMFVFIAWLDHLITVFFFFSRHFSIKITAFMLYIIYEMPIDAFAIAPISRFTLLI